MISPGYVQTNLSLNAITSTGDSYGQTDRATAEGDTPEYVAGRTMKAIMRGDKEVIISPLLPRFIIFLRYFWPTMFFRVMSHLANKK